MIKRKANVNMEDVLPAVYALCSVQGRQSLSTWAAMQCAQKLPAAAFFCL